MEPLEPFWTQPSHSEIQDVIISRDEFTSKSLSKVSLPPFSLYAKMAFPPCTMTEKATYATVQVGPDQHMNLNSDLLYINHSCEPSLIFDTTNLNILAGPNGLKAGEELTFFYPSTEWEMAQAFDCLCGKPSCRGRIAGAKSMTAEQLAGVWLNGHIHELLNVQHGTDDTLRNPKNGTGEDPTAQALRATLQHAEKVVEAARAALASYVQSAREGMPAGSHAGHLNGVVDASQGGQVVCPLGSSRRGATSRELSGEMGGDTICA